MIEDTKFRVSFIAYFYSLYLNPMRHKYLINNKNVFNKREYTIYQVLEKMINDDEEINKATVMYEMNMKQITNDFLFIHTYGEKERFDTDRIDKYYNLLYKEYTLDLFRSAKSDADIQFAVDKLQEIQELTNSAFVTASEAYRMLLTLEGIENIPTGLNLFDKKIYLSSGIFLIAGAKGSGKTSLLVELIKRLLILSYNKKRIAIQWNTMEDRIRMIMAKIISKDVNIPAKLLARNSNKLKESPKVAIFENLCKSFNIEFQDKQLSISEIKTNWKAFLKKEKKLKTEFPILIIDNIMQLTDHGNKGQQTEKDDYVCNQISYCRNEAKKLFGDKYLIFVLHHIGKEAGDKENAKNAYIPNEVHVKGSTRYLDLPQTAILCHWFGAKADLKKELAPFAKYLEKVMHIQCIKNRENGWLGEDRIWMNMDYNFAADYYEEQN